MIFKKIAILSAVYAVFSCSPLFAQDYHLSHLGNQQSNFSGTAKQARVESLPSDFFTTSAANIATAAQYDEAASSDKNVFVLIGFASLLSAGGLVTGVCLLRRRQQQSRPAAPAKLFI